MIPKVEDILVRELERRVCAALGGMAASPDGEPETFTVTFESRKFSRCVQQQENLVLYGKVEAELALIFYSQRERIDYSPLCASFARDHFIKLADGLSASVELDRCEAVEGPYLSNDAWLVKASYYVFEIEDATEHQPPHLANTDTGAPDLYPRPAWDNRDEPGAVL